MKTKKLTGYAFFSIIQDENERFPEFYSSERKCIEAHQTYFGVIGDDPKKRGGHCEGGNNGSNSRPKRE